MRKSTRLLVTLAFLGASAMSIAQTLVSTFPQNKNVVIEEFTGVKCGPCVGGASTLQGILDANPGRIFGVAMSPMNSSLTSPYTGDEDLRRSYLDAFYTNPYYGNGAGRAMPTAHINRTKYGGARKVSSGSWSGNATAILNDPSPVNVGLSSTYNGTTHQLDVVVEIYYTQDVTANNKINVVLIESGVITEHASYGVGFSNDHQFRVEIHSGQWGEAVSPTLQGSLVTFNFTYDNATTLYDMSKAEVVAYVSNSDIEEVYSAAEVAADGGITIGEKEISEKAAGVEVYPNPMMEEAFVHYTLNQKSRVNMTISDVLGNVVYRETLGDKVPGNHVFLVNKSEMNLSSNLYFIVVETGNGSITKKLVVQ